MATCYRHPGRETNVSCSNCGRPICPDCMTSTPVGMRCPECASQKTKVHRGPQGFAVGGAAPVTFGLMIACVIAFLAEVAGGADLLDGSPLGDVGLDGALLGWGIAGGELIGVAEGEPYRILTGGFLHSGVLHLGLNLLALYFLGTLVEPALGARRFLGIYLLALLGGSLGALIMDPLQLTVGASGAVFGLMAAGFLIARDRGLDDVAAQIGFYVVINLVFTFSVPNISVGGHVGGLLVGGAVTMLLLAIRRGGGRSAAGLENMAMAGAAVLLVLGCIMAADASIPAQFA